MYSIIVKHTLSLLLLFLPLLSFANNTCGKKVAYCQGERHYRNGDYYTGEFRYGKPHGEGVMVWKDGSRYEGQFKKGYREGVGEQTLTDGSKYYGQFVDGFMQGEGIYHFPNGATYEGHFEEDMMHGQGTLTYSNGDSYTGQWSHEVPDGIGTYRLADGTAYETMFRSSKRYGKGVVNFSTGDQLITQWKKGTPTKSAHFKFANSAGLRATWDKNNTLRDLSYVATNDHTFNAKTLKGLVTKLEKAEQYEDIENIALVHLSIAMEHKVQKQFNQYNAWLEKAKTLVNEDSNIHYIVNEFQKLHNDYTTNIH